MRRGVVVAFIRNPNLLVSIYMLKRFIQSIRCKDHTLIEIAPARVQQSFDRKLSTRIFLAILCTALLALTIIAPTYHAYTLSRQNLYDIQDYRLLLDTANYLSAERGPANIVMSEDFSPDGAGSKRLAEFRARADAALAHLSATSEAPFGLHYHPIPQEMLTRVRDQLALARSNVDRVAAIPQASLTLPEFQGAIESMFEVSDSFRTVIAWRVNELVEHDTGLAAPALVGQMLSDLREYGGRLASQIMAPIATSQGLPLNNVIDARRSQGRLLELWQLINSQNALYNTPALAKSRGDIERLYFRDGLDLVNHLISEGRRGAGYSLSATGFTDRFVPTMRPIETYRRAFLDATVEKFAQAKSDALAMLATVALVTTTILAILIGLILSVRTHIFRPLIHAHDQVLRLAEDSPIAASPRPTQADEIRNLFRAIEVLQGRLQERASVTSELRIQADTDGLTALLNRRALDRLAQSPSAPGCADDAVCLILMDLDHFKAVNDTHGHVTGDRVLIQTAELLRSLLRSGDLVARFGGEEFAILVPGGDLSGAISIAKKIRRAIQRKNFMTSEGIPFSVTASFGVARGRRGEDAWQQLIEIADTSLYRAKSDGRNRVRFARHTVAAPSLTPSAPDIASSVSASHDRHRPMAATSLRRIYP